MNPTHYPPAITPGFMGVKPPPERSPTTPDSITYFQNYRNEYLSRMQSLPYTWGDINIEYTAKADIALLNKTNNLEKFIRMPQSQFSMLDPGRQKEIDDFYMVDTTYQCLPSNFFFHFVYLGVPASSRSVQGSDGSPTPS
jgi:hypothetical protein